MAHPFDAVLFESIAQPDVGYVCGLLAAGANANAVSVAGTQPTALIAAVQVGSKAIAQALLDRGAWVEGRDRRGQTALMAAAAQCHGELVALLIEAGAEVNLMSGDRDTAVGLATGAARWVDWPGPGISLEPLSIKTQAAEADGAEFDTEESSGEGSGLVRQTPSGPQQLCPVPEAAVIALLEQLVAAGADLNRAGCAAPPLMEAARNGRLRLVRWLLAHGARPDLAAHDGKTALDIARLYNQTQVLALLEGQ